jgi:hypothetical protein
MVEGALEVAGDVFRNREMRLTGVVYVEAHVLDRVEDVRPGEGLVLESPVKATVSSRVTDGGTHVSGDIGLSVDQRRVRFAVAHTSVLKDILSVLMLVKKRLSDHYSTEMPRTWWRGSRSLIVNYCLRGV